MQKTAFYNVKGILSQRKRYRFAIQNKAFEVSDIMINVNHLINILCNSLTFSYFKQHNL